MMNKWVLLTLTAWILIVGTASTVSVVQRHQCGTKPEAPGWSAYLSEGAPVLMSRRDYDNIRRYIDQSTRWSGCMEK